MATFGDQLRKLAGGVVNAIGTKAKLPEMNIGERIAGTYKASASAPKAPLNKPTNTTSSKVTVPQGISSSYGGGGGGSYNNSSAGVLSASTGGQSEGGGGGDEGGGYDYLGALRDAFGQSRSALEGMLPTYDSDFSNFKSTVEGGINRAKETLGAQNQEDERLFGTDLRSLLQTDKEIRQRQQGVYSGLNALDSSAYKDDVLKQDQYLTQNQQGLEAEKRRNYETRQREYSAYEQEATSKISSYQNEIQRAKQGLQQAIASTNMDEAQSIQNYISQLQQQAQQVAQQREAMAMNLMQLQAQGTDVLGNLGKTNMSQYSNLFGKNLAGQLQNSLSRFNIPGQAQTGAGYIGQGKSDDELKRLGLA